MGTEQWIIERDAAVKKCNEQERYISTLEKQIRYIRDQRGDDKCWKDWETLFAILPEGYTIPERDETVEIDLCKKYISSCHNPAIKYVSPQRRIEELEEELAECNRQIVWLERQNGR